MNNANWLSGDWEFMSVDSVRHKIVVLYTKIGKLRTGKKTTFIKCITEKKILSHKSAQLGKC
jgi:hypothetical protein